MNDQSIELQTLPAQLEAKSSSVVDEITGNLKTKLNDLHTTMFANLDLRKNYIDQLKTDLQERYTAIVNTIDSYGQYVKMAGEQMNQHDDTMEQISDRAGVVGLDAVSTAIQ